MKPIWFATLSILDDRWEYVEGREIRRRLNAIGFRSWFGRPLGLAKFYGAMADMEEVGLISGEACHGGRKYSIEGKGIDAVRAATLGGAR